MTQLTINGRKLIVEKGTLLVEAAHGIGVEIPTMCWLKGYPHFTSCMICVVKERVSGRLLPACSAPAADGMIVETDTEEVQHARKSALDLLLSEHVGDCEAPCRLTCPAHMNIPQMMRQIAAGRMSDAIQTVKEHIPLPAILGRICHAPCEKACRRSRFDSSVAICLLKRFVADIDLSSNTPYVPVCRPATGKKVVIVGAGPAGLSASFYLTVAGHACTVLDEREEPGGQLRYGVPENILPRSVLDGEIEIFRKMNVAFQMKTSVGKDATLAGLVEKYDAIVLTPGMIDPAASKSWGVAATDKGLKVDAHTHRTSEKKIFAGGEAVQPGKLAVRAVGHGRAIAVAVDQYLQGVAVTGITRRFESRMGKIYDAEVPEFMKEADRSTSVEPAGGSSRGFSVDEAVSESRRCMHCDCRKNENCKLRDLTEKYSASQKHFNVEGRKSFTRITTHTSVVYEPGKCIKCGLCVRIAERAGEKVGLAFIGRGFESVVGVPFGESLGAGLQVSAEECVRNCPTGALAFKNS